MQQKVSTTLAKVLPGFKIIICHMCKAITIAVKNFSNISQTCVMQQLIGLEVCHTVMK